MACSWRLSEFRSSRAHGLSSDDAALGTVAIDVASHNSFPDTGKQTPNGPDTPTSNPTHPSSPPSPAAAARRDRPGWRGRSDQETGALPLLAIAVRKFVGPPEQRRKIVGSGWMDTGKRPPLHGWSPGDMAPTLATWVPLGARSTRATWALTDLAPSFDNLNAPAGGRPSRPLLLPLFKQNIGASNASSSRPSPNPPLREVHSSLLAATTTLGKKKWKDRAQKNYPDVSSKDAPVPPALPSPQCECGKPARVTQSMHPDTAARAYYKCGDHRDWEQCNFFQWIDGPEKVDERILLFRPSSSKNYESF
ncbi:hypothetical protein HU200_058471 [Digitaria exilis]|uniref:GRF-type domain-containing protein n=1 Tax=Digitaria exilis TaxID=1010633 RepID=A0A835A9N9_9POAL|nr:hypothetical protein HU200_058471 [Digitaria exilis]